MKIMGTTEYDTARITIEQNDLPLQIDEFNKVFKSRAFEALANVPLMPGAEKLVKHLHENGIPIAVATSSSIDSFNNKTAHLKHVFDLFHHVVSVKLRSS